MAILPLATGARLLGIHPKTLHHWLGAANFSLAPHPTDARIKCVAQEHLLEVARRHGRPLPDLPSAPGSPEEQAWPLPAHEVQPEHSTALLSAPSASLAGLIQQLAGLETKVVTLQEHLAQLALALLQERERTIQGRMTALETITAELVEKRVFPASLPDTHVTGLEPERAGVPPSPRQLNPAEQRARSRMPALVEYAASGSYVIISSQEGELSLIPDSREWFEWLATLSSFRFVGQSGRFTAYRDSDRQEPTRTWRAHRSIHQHRYQHCLGVTDRLTIPSLEQMAAKFQVVTSLSLQQSATVVRRW